MRVYFDYTRKYIGVQEGRVAVDIDDSSDLSEIRRKIVAKEFTYHLVTDEETETTAWDFAPAAATPIPEKTLVD